MRTVASILFLLLILLQANLWFGSHGVFQLWSLQGNTEEVKERNDSLMERYEALHDEVEELDSGQEALEERARHQLGFIKEGETFYRVIPKKEMEPN